MVKNSQILSISVIQNRYGNVIAVNALVSYLADIVITPYKKRGYFFILALFVRPSVLPYETNYLHNFLKNFLY